MKNKGVNARTPFKHNLKNKICMKYLLLILAFLALISQAILSMLTSEKNNSKIKTWRIIIMAIGALTFIFGTIQLIKDNQKKEIERLVLRNKIRADSVNFIIVKQNNKDIIEKLEFQLAKSEEIISHLDSSNHQLISQLLKVDKQLGQEIYNSKRNKMPLPKSFNVYADFIIDKSVGGAELIMNKINEYLSKEEHGDVQSSCPIKIATSKDMPEFKKFIDCFTMHVHFVKNNGIGNVFNLKEDCVKLHHECNGETVIGPLMMSRSGLPPYTTILYDSYKDELIFRIHKATLNSDVMANYTSLLDVENHRVRVDFETSIPGDIVWDLKQLKICGAGKCMTIKDFKSNGKWIHRVYSSISRRNTWN